VAGIIVLVLSIAALDSLNPSTVIPAVVLALGPSAPRRLLAFTTGVFLVSTLGGIVLLFAVGRPLLTRLAHPSAHARHLVELIVGAGLIVLATVLWRLRARVRAELDRVKPGEGRSAIVLGAGIMAIELPTAFPYFAAILAAVESARGVVAETALVLAYNAVFVAPLLGVLVLAAKTDREHLTRASALVHRWAPIAVPAGVAGIGVVLAALGGSRL
jgi:cytochrome c biogenesis protein CcdA